MSNDIGKAQAELELLLAQREALSLEINRRWQDIRMSRLVALRAGKDPGELPFFVGLDPQERSNQLRKEGLIRDPSGGMAEVLGFTAA